jgi:hypothetical protein
MRECECTVKIGKLGSICKEGVGFICDYILFRVRYLRLAVMVVMSKYDEEVGQ